VIQCNTKERNEDDKEADVCEEDMELGMMMLAVRAVAEDMTDSEVRVLARRCMMELRWHPQFANLRENVWNDVQTSLMN
jgi:hypothetical protein